MEELLGFVWGNFLVLCWYTEALKFTLFIFLLEAAKVEEWYLVGSKKLSRRPFSCDEDYVKAV